MELAQKIKNVKIKIKGPTGKPSAPWTSLNTTHLMHLPHFRGKKSKSMIQAVGGKLD